MFMLRRSIGTTSGIAAWERGHQWAAVNLGRRCRRDDRYSEDFGRARQGNRIVQMNLPIFGAHPEG
jgi:hypothetical protein